MQPEFAPDFVSKLCIQSHRGRYWCLVQHSRHAKVRLDCFCIVFYCFSTVFLLFFYRFMLFFYCFSIVLCCFSTVFLSFYAVFVLNMIDMQRSAHAQISTFRIWSIGQFSMEESWFPIKNPDFLLSRILISYQESGFAIRNPDFRLKNVDFII